MDLNYNEIVRRELDYAEDNLLPYISCVSKTLPSIQEIPVEMIKERAIDIDLKAVFFSIEKLKLNEDLAKLLIELNQQKILEIGFFTDNHITANEFKQFIQQYNIRSNIKIIPTTPEFRRKMDEIVANGENPLRYIEYFVTDNGTELGCDGVAWGRRNRDGNILKVKLLNTPEINALLHENYKKYVEEQIDKDSAEREKDFVINKDPNDEIRTVKRILQNPKNARFEMSVEIDVDNQVDTEKDVNIDLQIDTETENQNQAITEDNGQHLDEPAAIEKLKKLLDNKQEFDRVKIYNPAAPRSYGSRNPRLNHCMDDFLSALEKKYGIGDVDHDNFTNDKGRRNSYGATVDIDHLSSCIKQIFAQGVTHITEKALKQIAKNINAFVYGINLDNIPEDFTIKNENDRVTLYFSKATEIPGKGDSIIVRSNPIIPKLHNPFVNFLPAITTRGSVNICDPTNHSNQVVEDIARIACINQSHLESLIIELCYSGEGDINRNEKRLVSWRESREHAWKNADKKKCDDKIKSFEAEIEKAKSCLIEDGSRKLAEVYSEKGEVGLKKFISILEKFKEHDVLDAFIGVLERQTKGWSDILEEENLKSIDYVLEEIFPKGRTPQDKLYFFKSRSGYLNDFESILLLDKAYNEFQSILNESEITDEKERLRYISLFLLPLHFASFVMVGYMGNDHIISAVALERELKVLRYAAKNNCLYEQLLVNEFVGPGEFPANVDEEFGRFGYKIYDPRLAVTIDKYSLMKGEKCQLPDIPYNINCQKLGEILEEALEDKKSDKDLQAAVVRYLVLLDPEKRAYYGDYIKILDKFYSLFFRYSQDEVNNHDDFSFLALAVLTSTGDYFEPTMPTQNIQSSMLRIRRVLGFGNYRYHHAELKAFATDIYELHKRRPELNFRSLLRIAVMQYNVKNTVNESNKANIKEIEEISAELAKKYGNHFSNYCYNVINTNKCDGKVSYRGPGFTSNYELRIHLDKSSRKYVDELRELRFITKEIKCPDGKNKAIHEILCGDDHPEFLPYINFIKLPEEPTYQDILNVRAMMLRVCKPDKKFFRYNEVAFNEIDLRPKENENSNLIPLLEIKQFEELCNNIEKGLAFDSLTFHYYYDEMIKRHLDSHIFSGDETYCFDVHLGTIRQGLFFYDYFRGNERVIDLDKKQDMGLSHVTKRFKGNNDKMVNFEGSSVIFNALSYLLAPKQGSAVIDLLININFIASALSDVDVRQALTISVQLEAIDETDPVNEQRVKELQQELKQRVDRIKVKEAKAFDDGKKHLLEKFIESKQVKERTVEDISKDRNNFVEIFRQLAGDGMDGLREAELLHDLLCNKLKPLYRQIIRNGEKHDLILRLFGKIALRNPDISWQRVERVRILEAIQSKNMSLSQVDILFDHLSILSYKGYKFGGRTLGDILESLDREQIISTVNTTDLNSQFTDTTRFIVEHPDIENLDPSTFYATVQKIAKRAEGETEDLSGEERRKHLFKYVLDKKDYSIAKLLQEVNNDKVDMILQIVSKIQGRVAQEFIDFRDSAKWVNDLDSEEKISSLIKIIGGLQGSAFDEKGNKIMLTGVQLSAIFEAVKHKDDIFIKEVISLANLAIKKDAKFIEKFFDLLGENTVEELREGARTIYRDTNVERFNYNVERVCAKIEKISRKRLDNSQLMFVEKVTLLNSFITVMELIKNDPILVENGKSYAVRDLTNVQITDLMGKLKKKYATASSSENRDLKLQFTALAVESMYRSTGKFPRDVQVLSLLNTVMREDNMVHEIATGQGKGIVTALHATLFWFLGQTVDVTSADKDLSGRDLEEFAPYFDIIGAEHGDYMITVNSMAEEYKIGGINYSTASDFSLFRAKLQKAGKLREDTITSLICDEVDAETRNEINYRLAAKMTSKFNPNELRSLFKVILEFVEDDEKFIRNYVNSGSDVENLKAFAKAKFKNYGGNIELKYPLNDKMLARLRKSSDPEQKEAFYLHKVISLLDKEEKDINNMLDIFIDSACNAKMLVRGEDYNLPKEMNRSSSDLSVIPVVGTMPNSDSTFGFGIHQFVNLKEEKLLNKTRKPADKLHFKFEIPTAAVFNKTAKNFFDYYRNKGARIIGLTGTAGAKGSALEELFKYFRMETYSHPRFEEDRRKMLPSLEADNFEHQKKLLLQAIKRAGRNQHLWDIFRIFMDPPPPLMIFAENQNEAIEFYNHIKQAIEKDKRLKRYYDLDKLQLFANSDQDTADKKSVIANIGRSRGITICTQELARGTDPLLLDKVKNLCVINTTTIHTENDFYQVFGRTGRNGNEGFFISITNKEKYKGKNAAETRLNVEAEKREKRLKAMPLSEVTDYIQTHTDLGNELESIEFIQWMSDAWRDIMKGNKVDREIKAGDEKLFKAEREKLIQKVMEKENGRFKPLEEGLREHLAEMDKIAHETKQFKHITIIKRIEPKHAGKYRIKAEGEELGLAIEDAKKKAILKIDNYLNGKLETKEHRSFFEFIREILINIFWPKASDRIVLAKDIRESIRGAKTEDDLYKLLKEKITILLEKDESINKNRWFKARNITGSRLLNLFTEISMDVAEAAIDGEKANYFVKDQLLELEKHGKWKQTIIKDQAKLYEVVEQIIHSKNMKWDQSANIAAENIASRTRF